MCPYVSTNKILINVHKYISYVNILEVASAIDDDMYDKKPGMSYSNILNLRLRRIYHSI